MKLDINDMDTCFIIGNGPSLRKVDLSLIGDYPSFTVNMFYTCNLEFRSTYHVFIDPWIGSRQGFGYMEHLYRSDRKMKLIFSNRLYKKMKQKKMVDDRTYFVHLGYAQYKDFVDCDMCRCMTGALNVLPVAVECAIWMGYKKIFLLGCDFDFYGNTKYMHFYDADTSDDHEEDIDKSLSVLIRCALVRQHHLALRQEAEKKGAEIMNLTDGSLLDSYKTAALSDVLKES